MMHVSRLLVYPVKSLRPYEPPSAEVTKYGFTYDRRFMVLQVQDDGSLKNMHIAYFPELVFFFTSITFPDNQDASNGIITLTHKPSNGESKTMEMPLLPDTSDLEKITVTMHSSPTEAYKMQSKYNDWMSSCLGYEAIIAYLGEHERPVLMTTYDRKPQNSSGWLSSITSKLPSSLTGTGTQEQQDKITFADCAPFLVVSETSLHNVSSRLPQGEEMNVEKFRPNIIVAGAETEWEEDFWSELELSNGVKLHLVQNCVRCVSLNIDYDTGKPGTGESGKILKKLQRDRRVDGGAKYSPVFGRYAFLGAGSEGLTVGVGDEVKVTGRNAERTIFDWPGLSAYAVTAPTSR